MGEQKPYSYHIFSFPFRWDYVEKGVSKDDFDKSSFLKRTKLSNFDSCISGNNEKESKWKRNGFKIEKPEDYNEFVYFYDFARDAIYDIKKDKENIDEKEILFYEYNEKELIYSIKVKEKAKPYDLDIEKIVLTTYNTGVAILGFHLKNTKYEESSDILYINEFGRRIYPQFLSSKKKPLTTFTKEKFLADSISISKKDSSGNTESFCYYENLPNTDKIFKLPAFIHNLFRENSIKDSFDSSNSNLFIKPVVDDRMFVICWYGNNVIINRLQRIEKGKSHYKFENDSFWFEYVFIDKNEPSCANKFLLKDLLQKHTYARWIGENYEYPNLYGISRYSFVLLTNDSAGEYVTPHLKTMYYQMVALSLAQRASILRFSEEVTKISTLEIVDDQAIEKIRTLNKEYLRFSNKMYFREVTAQEQGIELYDLIQNHMRIERDVKDLNREIDELYQYANLLEEAKQKEMAESRSQQNDKLNKQMASLSNVATYLLLPALIVGIFGMNIFPSTWMGNYLTLVIFVVLFGLSFGLAYRITKKLKK